jgi:hypothetical protein
MRQSLSSDSTAGFSNSAVLFLEAGMQQGCARGALHHAGSDALWEFEIGGLGSRAGLRALRAARSKLNNRLLLAWSPMGFQLWNRLLRYLRLEEWDNETLCLRSLAARVLERPLPKNILLKIRSVYFTNRRIRGQVREPWEREIVFRWLAANRKRLNYIDIDEAGDFAAVVRRLTCYLNDPGKLSEKIYYR